MTLSVTFTAEPGRSEGYGIEIAPGTDIEPFNVDVGGVSVLIIPCYSGALRFGTTVLNSSLHSIAARLMVDYNGPMEYGDEYEQGNWLIPEAFYRRCHALAFEALQRPMMHLRAIKDDPLIDQRLSTLVLSEVADENGHIHYHHIDDPERGFFSSSYELTGDNWGAIAASVQAQELPDIHTICYSMRGHFSTRATSLWRS